MADLTLCLHWPYFKSIKGAPTLYCRVGVPNEHQTRANLCLPRSETFSIEHKKKRPQLNLSMA